MLHTAKEIFDHAIEQVPQELLTKLEIKPISLILLDFQMPRMNGIEVVENLRNLLHRYFVLKGIKIFEPRIVFLTAYKTAQFKRHLETIGI